MATAQKPINPVPVGNPWLPESETILVTEIASAVSEHLARPRSEEIMRALHPKLKSNTIRAKLTATAPDGSPQWLTPGFWVKEIDLVLLEGIHNGRYGQGDVIKRLRATWPGLDSQILKQRMEELATCELPAYLRNAFWQDTPAD